MGYFLFFLACVNVFLVCLHYELPNSCVTQLKKRKKKRLFRLVFRVLDLTFSLRPKHSNFVICPAARFLLRYCIV